MRSFPLGTPYESCSHTRVLTTVCRSILENYKKPMESMAKKSRRIVSPKDVQVCHWLL